MKKEKHEVPSSGLLLFLLILVNTIVMSDTYTRGSQFSGWMLLTLPLLLLLVNDMSSNKPLNGMLYMLSRIGDYLGSIFKVK